jgi:AraC-like DNA-binding protein
MFTDQTLININIVSIAFLVIMLAVISAATRMKGGAGWAAVCFLMIHIPVFLVNLMRDITSEYYLFFVYPAYTINLLGFPAIWFFTKSQFDKSFRLTSRSLLYAIPALISLLAHIVYYAPLSAAQVEAEILMMQAGGKNLPGIINDAFIHIGVVVTSIFIIRYVRQRMKYLRDHFSDSDYIEIRWVPRFLTFCFFGVLITAVAYIIHPRTDTWLIPIVNMAGMAFLVYIVIRHSAIAYINRLPDEVGETGEAEEAGKAGGVRVGSLSEAQMKEICDKVMNYLTTSGAYTNPNLTLAMLSVETGMPAKNISIAINSYLKKNFFDLVNELRVEEAKKRLRSLGGNYTIDSVAGECGFGSKRSFFRTFSKYENVTPDQWVKKNKELF